MTTVMACQLHGNTWPYPTTTPATTTAAQIAHYTEALRQLNERRHNPAEPEPAAKKPQQINPPKGRIQGKRIPPAMMAKIKADLQQRSNGN